MTQGNLVQNGGFEQGLAHWNVSPTHTVPQLLGNVDINEMENQSHSGMMSAELGVLSPSIPSGIWQDIPISPSSRFELVFHVTGLAGRASDLTVQVLWLDDGKEEIGLGLSIYIGKEALGMAADGEWQSHVRRINVSPNNARYARLVFSANGSGNSKLYIDDVVFYAVSNTALFNGGNLVQILGLRQARW